MFKYLLILYISFIALSGDTIKRVQSPISLPETTILKRDNLVYSEERLHQFILDGEIFSFLAYADDGLKSFALQERKLVLNSLFHIETKREFRGINIALLLPEPIIGRYSSFITKAVTSYLVSKGSDFRVKSYFVDNEDNQTLASAIEEIIKDKFKFVIAPMTQSGVSIIETLSPELFIYFPTIHKEKVGKSSNLFYFGGIDYKEQIKKLLNNFDGGEISLFYDKSSKGEELNQIVYSELNSSYPDANITVVRGVGKRDSDFSDLYKDKNDSWGSSFFINTTKIKSSILLSQLTAYEQEPKLIMSTQINYTPILLSMTQPNDRSKLLIANSISNGDETISDINYLLNNDITYDWINYSTTLGVDYFYHLISGESRSYSEQIIDNQIIYKTHLMRSLEAKFLEVEYMK